jgi:hypothetical protein
MRCFVGRRAGGSILRRPALTGHGLPATRPSQSPAFVRRKLPQILGRPQPQREDPARSHRATAGPIPTKRALQIPLLGQTLEHALKDGALSNLVFVFAA